MIDIVLAVVIACVLITALVIDLCWLCGYLRRSLNPDQ
jgi:hypothetical protein